jgi:hypothetical protein
MGLGRATLPLTGIADVTANMAGRPDPALYPNAVESVGHM